METPDSAIDAAIEVPVPDAPPPDRAEPALPDTAAPLEAPVEVAPPPDATRPPDATPTPDAPPPADLAPAGPAPDWIWSTPLPQGDDVVRFFVQGSVIYAFTRSFTLWRSTDDGNTWSVSSSISTQLMNDFPGWAHDATVGPDGTFWTVGEYHSMAKSTDGGRIFQLIFPGFARSGNFATVLALSDQVVLTGGTDLGLLRSTNGGQTFTSVVTSAMYSGPSALWTDGNAILLGTSDGGILRSTDGGLTFANCGGLRSAVVRAFAAAGRERFAATSLGLLVSADEGDTWAYVTPDGSAALNLWGVAVTPDGVWAVGQKGVVFFRRQGESAFTAVPGAGSNDFIALAATPGGTAIIYGLDGQLLRGSAGALTSIAVPSKYSVMDLVWTSPGHLAAATSTGKLLRSSDGAKTFTVTAPASETTRLTGIAVGAPDELYLAGSGGTVLRSTNGGDTFTALKAPAMSGSDVKKVWADSQGRVILRETSSDNIHTSTDHGQTWTTKNPSGVSGGSRGGVWADSTGVIWACASAGIYKSTDGGKTWTFVVGDIGNVMAIWGASADDLYYVTDSCFIGGSHDGGQTWAPGINFGGVANYGGFTGIWSSSPDAVYITGCRGIVARSNDRGATWIREATTTAGSLNAIAGSPAGEIAVGGGNGAILLRRQ